MKIVIACPSYHRPDGVDTLRYIPSCEVWVSNDEVAEYRKNYPDSNIIGVDPKYQGNLCRIRNHILDQHRGDAVCLIDDDMSGIGYHANDQLMWLVGMEQIEFFLWKFTVMALDLGVRMWGINVNHDKQCYREYTPFSLTSYIGGPFSVHVDSPLRYDERLPLKEDYDMTLQHINTFRKVLRVNKYFYQVKQAKQSGGVAVYRNLSKEIEQLHLLQRKWGKSIVKSDSMNMSRSHRSDLVRSVDINPIITVPIPGV